MLASSRISLDYVYLARRDAVDRLTFVERLRDLTVEAKRSGLNPDVAVDECLHAAATGMTAAYGCDYAIEKIENVLESLRTLRDGRGPEYAPDHFLTTKRNAARRAI
jgi:hypothetical protein